MRHQDLTSKIINAFYQVYNTLGYGFLENVYEKALIYELQQKKIACESQRPIQVFYRETPVGYYRADIIVENKVILEIKAAEGINPAHEAQLINYLKATNLEVGLLLNFGQRPGIKRKIFHEKRDTDATDSTDQHG